MWKAFGTVILSVFLFLAGCGPSVKNLDSQGTTIICFGDSITRGAGAGKDGDYPSFLQEMVEREVVNAGMSGDTTGSALDRVDEDVLENDPYLVIVELGANDYLGKVPKEKTINNLREMILEIQDGGAMVALCDVSTGRSIIGEFNVHHEELKQLAAETGSIFVPYLMKGIFFKPSLKTDQLHPNSEGYRIIAKRVYKAIKPYL